jgi:hypothetical protein
MNQYFKWIIKIILWLIISALSFQVNAWCIPDYKVFNNHENKIVYFPVEWFNNEIIVWPVFKIKELTFLDIYSSCGWIDVKNKERFTLFNLTHIGKLKYIINLLSLIVILFTPIFLYGYFIFRKTNYLFVRCFIFFVPFFFWSIYIISRFFLYSLIS